MIGGRRPITWSPIPENEPLPIILVGCGQWALHRTVGPLYRNGVDTGKKLFEVVGVTELVGGMAEFKEVQRSLSQVGARVRDDQYFPALNRAIQACGKGPLAVVVNTPNAFHDEHATLALGEGCHVYAERPINVAAYHLAHVLGRAISKGRYLYSGTQRRLEYPYVEEFFISPATERPAKKVTRTQRVTWRTR